MLRNEGGLREEKGRSVMMVERCSSDDGERRSCLGNGRVAASLAVRYIKSESETSVAPFMEPACFSSIMFMSGSRYCCLPFFL